MVSLDMISLELILLTLLSILIVFSVIISFVIIYIDKVITYNDKKLSDIRKIIKEAKISEIQKIENAKYTKIPTLDQRDRISEKFLNSGLITRSKISGIVMEDILEGEIESIPFISADLSVYEKYPRYYNIPMLSQHHEGLSLSGAYYYFDIPTIEKGVDIVLVPRIPFAVFIFFMLISLFFLWHGLDKNDFDSILISIIYIVFLLIAYYFEGSKTESIKFNSYFVLKTNDEIKARKILTPAVIQSIIDLREKEGEIMIAIKEGQLHVFIKNRDRFEYRLNYFLSYLLSLIDNNRDDLTKMKENIAQQVRQEIDLIKRLLKSIRLEETLYKKGIVKNKKGIKRNKTG